ncbi:hypothetical protein NP233_g2405 [Leucocoprinus birnbaumii]|uniref:ABC1 atypical kinase-like domain-containing protein n=1 Tax=Leucocoprinus birnbaumii TaxID=56174 RepID=A0AAD5YZ33_9AGAR|nr:hypothetical protein NP233_g2405 [Leucocoprinus birnbaumii]
MLGRRPFIFKRSDALETIQGIIPFMADTLAAHPYLVSFAGLLFARWLYGYSKDLTANPRRLPNPPGPKRYPVIGSLLDVPSSRPWLTHDKWFNRYGDLVYFEIMGKKFLVIGSLERANDLFEKRSANYSDRPRLIMVSELMGWDYNWGLIPYNAWWRRHRRAFHQFMNTNQLPVYLPTQIKHIRAFLRRILEAPDRFFHHSRHLFAALITDVAYGIQIKEENDPYIEILEEAMNAVGEAAVPGRYLVEIFPIMNYIPSWFPGANWKRKAAYVKELNIRVSQEPIEIVKENLKHGTAKPSIAASMIQAFPEDDSKEKAYQEQIAINVAGTAFLGGADTTVSTMQSFFLAMCQNPDIMEKAQRQLDSVLEGNRLPELGDRESLPYIEAIAKECIRWNPVLPMGVPHMVTDDDEYNGWFIPKGTIVIGSAWAILHDPTAYPDPYTFKPERFLKDGKLDSNVRNPDVAAFGYGRRICPGRHLSDISLFLAIASFLACFEIRAPLDDNGKPVLPSGEYTDGTFQFPVPFQAMIKPRSEKAEAMIRNPSSRRFAKDRRMPPSPAYNWLCVLHTTTEILSNIARHKASQIAPGCIATGAELRKHRRVDLPTNTTTSGQRSGRESQAETVVQLEAEPVLVERPPYADAAAATTSDIPQIELESQADAIPSPPLKVEERPMFSTLDVPVEPSETPKPPLRTPESELAAPTPVPDLIRPLPSAPPIPLQTRTLQSSKVPSSRIGRLFHYGGLAASLGYGAATELLRRTGSSSENQGSIIMTEANIRRLVSKLSQMRGAALKLGQFLSIQDTHLLPPDVDAIFRRVQDSAHYMPDSQLNETLSSELGPNWESEFFASFDRIPFAAASIGQVHSATLLPSATSTYSSNEPIPVAVKVQFPNIRHSISSDLSYVRMLLTASKILPRGMFLDRTIEVMKSELADECSYKREAEYLQLFARKERLGGDERFKVPWVWEGSTEGVLVMEKVEGVSVGEAQRLELTQRDRNDIAERIIELCLKELFEFRAMQTDPNWTNFLWNAKTRQIELVDFGATRTYTKSFMDNWLRLLTAAAEEDHEGMKEWSLKLGYLTGEESDVMLHAHTTSLSLLATPFKPTAHQPFAFGPGSEWSEITKQIREFIPVMLRERLTPPPRETYSLNRKLSGAFLLASRLEAQVDTRAVWKKVVSGYEFGTED